MVKLVKSIAEGLALIVVVALGLLVIVGSVVFIPWLIYRRHVEAKELAEQALREKAEREAREKAEQEAREQAAKAAEEAARLAAEQAYREAAIRAAAEAKLRGDSVDVANGWADKKG